MDKPQSLREVLEEQVPYLKKNPGSLHLFVDNGNIVARGADIEGWEYRYTLEVLITDYVDHSDTIILPILLWIRENQIDNLQNFDKGNENFSFQVDIIDHKKADIKINLKLTETIAVTKTDKGYVCEHLPEPKIEDWG